MRCGCVRIRTSSCCILTFDLIAEAGAGPSPAPATSKDEYEHDIKTHGERFNSGLCLPPEESRESLSSCFFNGQ